jgi:hypothetical protein
MNWDSRKARVGGQVVLLALMASIKFILGEAAFAAVATWLWPVAWVALGFLVYLEWRARSRQ